MAMSTALPVVDLRDFSSPADLAGELLRVGKDPGFFYLVGHGLGDKVTEGIFRLAASFFGCTTQEKQVYADGSGDLVSGSIQGCVGHCFWNLADRCRVTRVTPA